MRSPVVSTHGRFDTDRFNASGSRFDTNLKWIRYNLCHFLTDFQLINSADSVVIAIQVAVIVRGLETNYLKQATRSIVFVSK